MRNFLLSIFSIFLLTSCKVKLFKEYRSPLAYQPSDSSSSYSSSSYQNQEPRDYPTANFQTLSERVRDLEWKMDTVFRKKSISRLVPNYRKADLTNLDDLNSEENKTLWFGMEDSTLFSGIYLASQCMKYPLLTDSAEKQYTLQTISELVASMNELHEITEIPGLIARHIYTPTAGEPNLLQPRSILLWTELQNGYCHKNAKFVDGSGKYKNSKWCGYTSRDQYAGFIYGLGICHKLAPNSAIKLQTAKTIYQVGKSIQNNSWSIPYGKYQNEWPNFSAQTIGGYIKLMLAKHSASSLQYLKQVGWVNQAEFDTYSSKFLQTILQTYADLPKNTLVESKWLNQHFEYYSFNLSSLSMHGVYEYESDPFRKSMIQEIYDFSIWKNTKNDENAQTYFLKGIISPKTHDSEFQSRQTNALKSVWELSRKERFDLPRKNPLQTCAQDPRHQNIVNLLNEVRKIVDPKVSSQLYYKVPQEKCADPIPYIKRGFEEYSWQSSPYLLYSNPELKKSRSGFGYEVQESSSVDTIFAYWLARYAGVLNENE